MSLDSMPAADWWVVSDSRFQSGMHPGVPFLAHVLSAPDVSFRSGSASRELLCFEARVQSVIWFNITRALVRVEAG